MSEIPFYKTRMGRDFYDRTMPTLVEELARLPFEPIDADAVLRDGLAHLNALPTLLEKNASLEERKAFVRLFIEQVSIEPDAKEIVVTVKRLPFPESDRASNKSSVDVVAGGGYEPLQMTIGLQKRLVAKSAWQRIAA